tara:strand:- start:2137 stop:3027 length:891 start_codon:yes stop_codon:yes gene_type:complete
MIEKKLYGLEKYLSNLIELFDNNKLPKVLMLTGKKGQGKFTLVNHLISYIFDKENYDLKDNSILNENKLHNIKDNFNGNVIYFNCIKKNIKIEEIRNLKLTLQKSSINNFNRFVIFDDVEYLSGNCVNALLKTIEEPSITNYFILINNQKQNILETLKSRSIEFIFFLNNSLKIDILKKLLLDHNIESKIAIKNSKLTPGNYLRYNKILLDDKININDNLISNLKKLFKLNKLKKDEDYLSFAIYLVDQYYFNISRNSTKVDNINNKRIKIIKKIHDSSKLNLNHTNLLVEIENYI